MRAAAVKQITLDAHQLHGGMGYVVDTDLHLFSERARVLATLDGGGDTAAKWIAGEMDWEGKS
jgi:alkylation response protein AidB-like acyl-CoA dehydrogenase